ncbi:hypothetical protein DIS24_g12 [Lasiodiplodia hormozganensis]|uniref:Uncharacterized protein n=1 Tax=Lasiodiplodia hormozganensis TaxID=869390 RepID=A0AA39Z6Q0_9PEZI|nr:uncharacterized protein LTHEOB_6836 [Lasiodiplodia theobromae]KAF4543102.1 hypothetical protein LTHEOB_6836 [Lasiodiplodia theobromae]KAK0664908.1 hypothetical protein DIS24_g12 [Lasiodiplodia hormozganensis]
MPNSLESSRPMLNSSAARNSARLSTYSNAPTLTPSIAPSTTSSIDPRAAEIKAWNAGLDRLEDKRLVSQRYVASPDKIDNMSKLALGAKLDRALARRMSEQDAVFRQHVRGVSVDEKSVSEKEDA